MVTLESGNESSVQNCYKNGLDSDRSNHEAVLMKFRMKRKDRCFGKKVDTIAGKSLQSKDWELRVQFVSQKLKSATTADAETDS